jgi:hypothetical protein
VFADTDSSRIGARSTTSHLLLQVGHAHGVHCHDLAAARERDGHACERRVFRERRRDPVDAFGEVGLRRRDRLGFRAGPGRGRRAAPDARSEKERSRERDERVSAHAEEQHGSPFYQMPPAKGGAASR